MNGEVLTYAANALSGPLLLVMAAFACLLLPLFFRALRGAQGVMALSAALAALAFLRRAPLTEIDCFNGALILNPASAWLWAFAFAVLAVIIVLSLARPLAGDDGGEAVRGLDEAVGARVPGDHGGRGARLRLELGGPRLDLFAQLGTARKLPVEVGAQARKVPELALEGRRRFGDGGGFQLVFEAGC